MRSRHLPKRGGEPRPVAGISLLERLYRPGVEPLEDRVMLDSSGGTLGQLPPAIVVGRTLSSYFAGGIQNNQETITYTVYNEQANPETGVLLTTTLEPGVTISSVSTQPNQSGQDLAWSLGTINGFGRASVTLTVSLASPTPLQLDTGAQAYATLDAGAVSNSTPAAVLRPGTVDPTLLASTPDANTTDPFIQEEAAALGYDPQRIFSFLHTQIGYNSYLGSVRGARGTLWSSAGNALDLASLGVALMRASGIPAQYVQGTLSQSAAQTLILSMFPATDQTVGAIASGETPAAPQDSATLLDETESHDWFQFDTGSGMTDADPLIPGATIGQTFTTSSGTFAEVPDSLRATTEIKLNAEISSAAGALFGEGPSTTTVLDQTFNDVDLVGHPITVGNFVQSAAAGGLIFTSVTNTYSPYLEVGDEANADPSRDEVLHGTPYQEVLTNFPLGSQILTGLFMDVTLSGPQSASATFEKMLVDRIGFAARQGAGTVVLPPISPTGQPILTNNDLWTLNALPGLQSPDVLGPLHDALVTYDDQLNTLTPTINAIPANGPQTPEQSAALTETGALNRTIALLGNEIVAIAFARASDKATAQIEPGYQTLSYVTSPRLLVASTHQDGASLSVALDLLKDDARDIETPGQAVGTSFVFEQLRGYLDSDLEGQIITAATGQQAVSFTTVFNELANEGGHLVMITQENLTDLNGLALSPDAKARITQEVTSGFGVLTPSQMVTINGQATVEWLQFNLSTGQVISVTPDGAHQALVEYEAILNSPLNLASAAFIGTMQGFGLTNIQFLGIFLGEINTGKDFKEVIRDALAELIIDLAKDYAGLAIGVIPTEGLGQEVLKSILGLEAGAVITGKLPSPLEIGQEVIKLLIPEEYATLVTAYEAGLVAGAAAGIAYIADNFMNDPPDFPFLSTELAALVPSVAATGQVNAASNLTPTPFSSTINTVNLSVTNQLTATWSSSAASAFLVATLAASSATVTDASGKPVGTGAVALTASAPITATVSGTDHYLVNGTGSLSFYGPAESSLGVSGDWSSFSATVTGGVSITLATAALMLNGQPLPAGTYTITTTSAGFTGSGPSTSPNFSGSAAINPNGATVDLGPASGTLTTGGKPLDPKNGATLTGYIGTIIVSANGDGTDSATLNGNPANLLTVSGSPATLTTDQNTPVTFTPIVQTSLADTYTLTAQAPTGWTLSIDAGGRVTAMPAPGLQSGTYPIQIIAQSTTTPDLVAQAVVDVTITPTTPGITLNVAPDPLLTVPFNGAQLPTAFNAIIHNDGPAADTYNLTVSNLPSGFTLLESGTTVTIPAGATGSLGLYLQPNPGQPIAPPGTQLSFTVTATSTTDPSITQTQVETFTVPAIDGVTATASPTALTSTAGTPATTTLTLANVGNVAETVTLSSTLPTGLTASGLGPVTIQPGTSATVTIALTPDATVPLNRTLAATITAIYGPSTSPQTTTAQVNLTVRSAEVVALQQAANAAQGIPGSQVAANLSNLADALSELQGDPTNAPLLGRVQFLLGNLDTLLRADPALVTFVTGLQPLQTAAGAGDVTGLLSQSTAFFTSIAAVLAQEADEQFTATLSPTEADLQPGQGQTFNLQLTSESPDPVSLSIGVGALPGGVTVVPGQSRVTLAPGQTIMVPVTLSQTIQSTRVFTLDVTANAGLIENSATAVVAIRPAAADVLGVTASPPTPGAGAPVSVTAEVFNTANAARDVVAKLDLLDASGNLVSTAAEVPVSLVPGAGDLTLNLGQVATTGLANGLYSVRVSLLTSDGSPLPGQSSQTDFEVGQPVTAAVAASTSIVPPGTSTVTTAITVTNETVIPTGGTGGSQPGPSSITLELGYADNLRANPFFPNPWVGSPNTVFVGDTVLRSGEYDGGALRIINNGTTPITVNDVSVTFANGAHYDLWGSNVVPAGDNLILTQTNGQNFDTSDVDESLPFPQTYPDGETAHAAKINITVNGVPLPTFLDTGHILTTGGSDLATRGANESQNWRPVGTTGISNPGGLSALVTVTHKLPTTGYTINPTTINPAPSSSSSSQLVWSDALVGPVADSGPSTFQFSGTVANMAPGEVRQISLGTSVVSTIAVSGQQLMTTIPVAPLTVAADHIISIDPASQTADRDTTATYQVTLTNPLSTPETYTLGTDGLAGFTTSLAASVNVGPGQTVTTPLTVTVPLSGTAGTQVFTVFAQTSEGGTDSVEGQLTVSPQVALPTQAVNIELAPMQATAGLGTSATYEVVVTNLGDTSDTYGLSGSFPAGLTATFAAPTVTVPPGQGNFREVLLTLTPQTRIASGALPFTVTATSMTRASVMSSASGTLTVLPNGVGVTLSPSSGAPGSGFQTTVTNTGSVADTFDLALAGPAALVASLGTSQVTLAPGASQVVPITTSAVNFAVPGALTLTAMATSHANPEVQAGASASLTIATTEGLTAQFQMPSRVLPMLGTSPFLLIVDNTGNAEDSYTATITGTSGPVSASLTGLDGQPTQTISLFRLPGLSSGSIVLPVNLMAFGQGAVTVKVQSLSDPTETVSATGMISAIGATTTQLAATPNPATVGQPVTFTATVSAQSGTLSPAGTVTFTIDGQAQTPVALQEVNGMDQAVFTDSTLAAGPHSVSAAYSGNPAFIASIAMPLTETVNKQPSTTTLAAAPNPSTVGQPVTFTATVTPATSTGTVDFVDTTTGVDLGTAPVHGGIATLPPIALAVGDHAITASYSGDPNSAASTSGASIVRVVPIVTTTGLSVAPNPSTVGESVTFTATVTPTSRSGAPTGTVIFAIDGTPQAPVALQVVDNVVQATIATAALGAGPHQVSASYSGDASFAPSSAGPDILVVKVASPGGTTAAPTATTVQATPDPAPFGQAITLSATVAHGSGSSFPVGTLTFFVDGAAQAPVGLKVVNGQTLATLTIPGPSAGTHQVQASYSGDANFAPSVSTAVVLVVNPAPVVTPPIVDGPRVTDVRRYGYHWAPTTLVLNFNEPLDPTRAQVPSNYRIMGLAGRIPLVSAVYDPGTKTVTLHPSQRLDVHKRYLLIVNGEGPLGLTDPSGNLLDGNGQGKPGVSYVTTVTIHNLIFGKPTPTLAPRLSAGFGQRSASYWVPTGSRVVEHVETAASTPVRAAIHRTPSVKPSHHK